MADCCHIFRDLKYRDYRQSWGLSILGLLKLYYSLYFYNVDRVTKFRGLQKF